MSGVALFAYVFGGAAAVVVLFLVTKALVSPKRIHSIERLIESGNTKAAIRQVKLMLARNKKNIDAHWLLGECYRAENRPDLAVVEYRYISNAGRYTGVASERRVRVRLAEEFLKLKQLDESQKEYILLSKLEPGNYEHYYQIGRLFEERNLPDPALVNYKRVISLNPSHAEAHMRVGVILFHKKDHTGAQKSFQAALQASSKKSAPNYYLGMIAKVSGDIATALTYIEKSLHDHEFRQRALLERADIFALRRDYPQAIQELKKALTLGEDDLSVTLAVRYLLARCYETVKDIGEAIVQWEWINARNPRYRDVASRLALYADLRTDDRLKDFLITPQEKFGQHCERIVRMLGFEVQEITLKNQEIAEIVAFESRGRGREETSSLRVIRIFRGTDPVGTEDIREIYDQMKRMNVMQGICITASKFSQSAIEFAQTRPIELVDKDELVKLLHRMDRR